MISHECSYLHYTAGWQQKCRKRKKEEGFLQKSKKRKCKRLARTRKKQEQLNNRLVCICYLFIYCVGHTYIQTFVSSCLSDEDRATAEKAFHEVCSVEECCDLESCQEVLLDFEAKVSDIKHGFCSSCMCVSLKLELVNKGDGSKVCKHCKFRKTYTKDQNTTHPVWFNKDDQPQYQVPKELENLREAEKLLISMVSVYIPLQHLCKGQLGCHGHVCCFCQEIGEICMKLPRMPHDVQVIRVVRKFVLDGGEIGVKTFSVRKDVVLAALRWLKENNILYKDIEIAEENLDWIEDGVEQELPGKIHTEIELKDKHPSQCDLGPSVSQFADVLEDADYSEQVSGGIMNCTEGNMKLSDANNAICRGLEEATKASKKIGTMSWPYVSDKPVSEYDKHSNLFCKAFPWLFPGGVGDYYQYREEKISAAEWAKRMVLYKDGRFAKDKMWGFFALNYVERRKNQSSGGFFVNSWFKEGEKTLEQLKMEIEGGNLNWIDKITYYSQRVRGSPAYWRSKRAEVYTWINYHVNAGNGAPNFFITLSCAEYYWKDVRRLINDRYEAAGLVAPDQNKSWVETVNDHTLIVQEYFQERVKIWLETVGKKIFKIQHYWLRFEFTPSRGQIHVHMLAISSFQHVFERYSQFTKNRPLQAELLRLWSEKFLGMTCNVDKDISSIFEKDLENHPASKYYVEVEDHEMDKAEVLLYLQQHACGGYCMRPRKQL
jgi:hypothetical protein